MEVWVSSGKKNVEKCLTKLEDLLSMEIREKRRMIKWCISSNSDQDPFPSPVEGIRILSEGSNVLFNI